MTSIRVNLSRAKQISKRYRFFHAELVASAIETRDGIATLSTEDFARISAKLNDAREARHKAFVATLDDDERAIVAEIDKQPEGIGDTLKKLFEKIGADRAAKLYKKITGRSCGCEVRRRWLNRWWPYSPLTRVPV